MGNNNDSASLVNLNLNGQKENTYDVIVIGSGISGGWAAKEFCEKGLKTLVLERGRMVEHIKDYPTANTSIWEFPHRNKWTEKIEKRKSCPFPLLMPQPSIKFYKPIVSAWQTSHIETNKKMLKPIGGLIKIYFNRQQINTYRVNIVEK